MATKRSLDDDLAPSVKAIKLTPDDRITQKLGESTPGKEIKVIVGTGTTAQDFHAHERILRHHSDFFLDRLRRGWRQEEEAVINLPEEDPELFEIFTTFVYEGQLETWHEEDDLKHGINGEWRRLARCWALGDKLMSLSFKDVVLDALTDKLVSSGKYPLDLHQTVYAPSTRPSKLKELVVDIAVWCWNERDFEDQKPTSAASDFFCEVSKRFCGIQWRKKKGRQPWVNVGCKYHEHKGMEKCYKEMFPNFGTEAGK